MMERTAGDGRSGGERRLPRVCRVLSMRGQRGEAELRRLCPKERGFDETTRLEAADGGRCSDAAGFPRSPLLRLGFAGDRGDGYVAAPQAPVDGERDRVASRSLFPLSSSLPYSVSNLLLQSEPIRSFKYAPQHLKDVWFNEFKKKHRWDPSEEDTVRLIFQKKGAKLLSDHLREARKGFAKNRAKPDWISDDVMAGLVRIWGTDEFKKLSEKNKRNKNSDCD
nr:putative transposase En/Spm [Ipomoea batatas]